MFGFLRLLIVGLRGAQPNLRAVSQHHLTQKHLQGRKSAERPFLLRIAEDFFCLFGSGFAGLA